MTCVDQRDQYTWADDRSHTLHAHGAVDSDIYFDRVTFFRDNIIIHGYLVGACGYLN